MTPDAHTKTGLVTVVGGGLGGLAASIALRNAGVTTQVFERAAQFAEVGVAVGSRRTDSRHWTPRDGAFRPRPPDPG